MRADRRQRSRTSVSKQHVRRTLIAAALLGVTLAPIGFVHACGYHDPSAIRIGILNWIYPNALHVNGAIWSAQKAGTLRGPDRQRIQATGMQRKFLDSLAFNRAAAALRGLGKWVGTALQAGEVERFAVVLVESGMWTRFSIDGNEQLVEIDVNGPGEAELVLVTGEAVLDTMRRGELSLAEAVDSGLIRLYRKRSFVEPTRADAFTIAYGSAGLQALPKVAVPFSPEDLARAGHTRFSAGFARQPVIE